MSQNSERIRKSKNESKGKKILQYLVILHRREGRNRSDGRVVDVLAF